MGMRALWKPILGARPGILGESLSRNLHFGPGPRINQISFHNLSRKFKVNPVQAFATYTTTLDQGVFFAHSGIDRAAERRADSAWISQVLSTSSFLVVPVLKSKNLVKDGKPVILSSEKFQSHWDSLSSSPIFLGLIDADQVPIFALDISTLGRVDAKSLDWLINGEWIDLRRHGPNLEASDGGLLAYARGMVEWQARNKFCGCCGATMEMKDGGHSLKCSREQCGNSVYPRLDPAVIMLVACNNHVLLGRQSRWERGRYSVLAGFVEVGETFEMAIVREVEEEAGIKLNGCDIRYSSSQPWPFPSSLMVGFSVDFKQSLSSLPDTIRADIVSAGEEGQTVLAEGSSLPKISTNGDELEDVRWIHKDYLSAAISGQTQPTFHVPGKHAIARSLMEKWVSFGQETPWSGDKVKVAEIDEGFFKYVLVRIIDGQGKTKLVVRGDKRFAYHADVFNDTQKEVKALGLKAEVLGGGRIEHFPEQKIINVFGFSQAYGEANHAVTAALLQRWFPFYTVSVSKEGY